MCLHGFTDTWRTWELVLPSLERHHDVLAPTLAGHAGGPPLPGEITDSTLADAVERAMDEAAGAAMIEHARRAGWNLDAEQITCRARIVWGTEDAILG